jgi:hypothetical protein
MTFIPKPPLMVNSGIGSMIDFENDGYALIEAINEAKPKNILETGFFQGGTSFIFLYYSTANVTSVDPMGDPKRGFNGRIENVEKIKALFPGRFNFIQKASRDAYPELMEQSFDFFFIDGDHTYWGAAIDLQIAINLKIPYVFIDDFVHDVYRSYTDRFSGEFTVVKEYDRTAHFEGKPIKMALLKNNHA